MFGKPYSTAIKVFLWSKLKVFLMFIAVEGGVWLIFFYTADFLTSKILTILIKLKKYLNNMCFQKFFMLKIFNDKKRILKGFDYFLNY